MTKWARAYDKWSNKIKVDANFSWWTPWWVGALFTLGYADPQFEGILDLIGFFIIWPIILGEAMR